MKKPNNSDAAVILGDVREPGEEITSDIEIDNNYIWHY